MMMTQLLDDIMMLRAACTLSEVPLMGYVWGGEILGELALVIPP